jgi:hypothetical protein
MKNTDPNPNLADEASGAFTLLKSALKAAAKPVALFSWVIGLFLSVIGLLGQSDNDLQNWIKVPGVIHGSSIETKIVNRSLSKFTSRHSVSYIYENLPYAKIIEWGSEDGRGIMEQKLGDFLRNWDGFLFIAKDDFGSARLSLEDRAPFRQIMFSGCGLLVFAAVMTVVLVASGTHLIKKL